MDFIQSANKQVDKFGAGKHGFSAGNPVGGVAATFMSPAWCDDVQQELINSIEASGASPAAATRNQLLTALRLMFSSLVGSMSNAKMVQAAASASGTLTADEVVVGTALGGQTFRLANFNKTVNLGTVGAGGMDTGAAPVNGFVALYAIFNPTTGASALLAANATAAVAPTVYGGANMPAGYTASALVSVWPTNGSSQFKPGFQLDRQVNFPQAAALATTASTGAVWTLLSLATIVPRNAKSIGGTFDTNNNLSTSQSTTLSVASDSAGSGQLYCVYALTSASGGGIATPFTSLQLPTVQSIWYQSTTSGGTPNYSIKVSSYTF